jgi:hypothetical protein
MAQAKPQSFENHTRIVPAYHMIAFPILAINLLWALYQAGQNPSAGTVIGVLLAFALIIIFLFARLFTLTVQDRVIRLEERLRMERLLPPDLQPRIPEFAVSQLVALRFASDEELPVLARRVLTENITDRKVIKRMIQRWNPDHLRA